VIWVYKDLALSIEIGRHTKKAVREGQDNLSTENIEKRKGDNWLST
jgi:hypothetical protein